MNRQSPKVLHSILSHEDIGYITMLQNPSLMMLFEYHNAIAKELVGKAMNQDSYQSYQTTLEYLSGFIYSRYRTEDISLQRLSYKFIAGFAQYLEQDLLCSKAELVKYTDCLMQILIIALAGGLTGMPVMLN
jgi:hypothetical protein